MDKVYKVLIVVVIAIIAGSIVYYVTPSDWPEGRYTLILTYTFNGKEYDFPMEYTVGSGSSDVVKTFNVTVGSSNYVIEVEVHKLTKLSPGSTIDMVTRVLENGVPKEISLSNVRVLIKLPDDREFIFYPTDYDSKTGSIIFSMQPYVKAKEAGFVFGSAIVLFAAASIIHYVITGLYATLALVLLGVISAKSPFRLYMSNIILIFIAGSALELIIKETGLDKRVASLLSRIGDSTTKLVIGSTFLVSFLSMWMSNTAATYVMLPLVLVILNKVNAEDKRFSSILLASLAMAASVGGTATLIGTPPNVLAAGFLNDLVYGTSFIGFMRWLYIGFPAWAIGYSIGVLLALAYMNVIARDELNSINRALKQLREKAVLEKKPWSREEVKGLINILILVGLWLTEPIHGLSAGISAAIGLLIFFSTGVLSVKKHWKMLAWDLMVLFGAGLTLGTALMKSGWANYVLSLLSGIQSIGWIAWYVIGFTAYTIGTFISSHTSASAFVAPLTIPLGMLLGASLGIPLEAGAAVATVTAIICLNNAVALPISTPPSAIVFSTGKVRMRDLVAYGLLYGIIANTIVITLLVPYWTTVLTP